MKKIRIQLEYRCYPVWFYDDEGLVKDTALSPALSGDRELDERFGSIQERYDATYVDTPTEFYNRGFATPEEEGGLQVRPERGRCGARGGVPRGVLAGAAHSPCWMTSTVCHWVGVHRWGGA